MGMMHTEVMANNSEVIELSNELPPIPEKSVAGWKEVPVDEGDTRFSERLVPVGAFSEFDDCDTSAVYFGERGKRSEEINFLGQPVNREASLITHFVREGVLERIKVAQRSLPKGYYFGFYDNFRPLDVQQALYDAQKEKFREEHPEWDAEQLEIETQKFVSIPAPNEKTGTKHPSPHSTGAVVDLTLIRMSQEGESALQVLKMKKMGGGLDYPVSDEEQGQMQIVFDWIEKQEWSADKKDIVRKHWLREYRYARDKAKLFKQNSKPLNMGTRFDEFTDAAGTTFYEKEALKRELTPEEQEVLRNRRFLYRVMTKAGFENYGDEWWHYSYGDNMWAKLSGSDRAFYGGFAELPEYCRDIESSRRAVYEQEITDFSTGDVELFTGVKPFDPTAI